jgi:hypothetical protein
MPDRARYLLVQGIGPERKVLAKTEDRAVIAVLRKYPIPSAVGWLVSVRDVDPPKRTPARYAFLGAILREVGMGYREHKNHLILTGGEGFEEVLGQKPEPPSSGGGAPQEPDRSHPGQAPERGSRK